MGFNLDWGVGAGSDSALLILLRLRRYLFLSVVSLLFASLSSCSCSSRVNFRFASLLNRGVRCRIALITKMRTAWKGPTQLLLLLLESSRWTRENPDEIR